MPNPYRKNNYRRTRNAKNHRKPYAQQAAPHFSDDDTWVEIAPPETPPVSWLPKMRDKSLPNAAVLLQRDREQLSGRLKSIKNRLAIAYSEPLNDYYQGLLSEDLALSCQLTECLCRLKS